MAIPLNVNGERRTVEAEPSTPLLYVLRNDLELSSPKFGCGLAQCGACAVLVDGKAVRSCVTPVGRVAGKKVTTLEGLGTPESPHPLQSAFLTEQAAQCGYCTSGMIVEAAGLLASNLSPSDEEIRRALDGHLCRCGAHGRIVAAVKGASEIQR